MDEGSASGRMNHYEQGRHVPDIETLRKIAKVLNVPLSYFFCEDEMSAELVLRIPAKLNSDSGPTPLWQDSCHYLVFNQLGR